VLGNAHRLLLMKRCCRHSIILPAKLSLAFGEFLYFAFTGIALATGFVTLRRSCFRLSTVAVLKGALRRNQSMAAQLLSIRNLPFLSFS
jgi:hypothetical protein